MPSVNRPSAMQFDESSDDYRCCCECMHIKTATILVGCTELSFMFLFLLNSLIILADVIAVRPMGIDVQDIFSGIQTTLLESTANGYILNSPRSYLIVPLVISFIWLFIGIVAVLSMFFGVAKRNPYMLLPHIFVQFTSLLFLIGALACSIAAVSTDHVIPYRLLNAVPFIAMPAENTVDLGYSDSVWMYGTIGLYALLLLLEICFLFVLQTCYTYMKERRRYMHYCLTYSTPMRTVHVRVPQYGTR